MSRHFKVFGRMRQDWEAMRRTCLKACYFVEAVDVCREKPDDAQWQSIMLQRLEELRMALAHLNGCELPKTVPPAEYHGLVLAPIDAAVKPAGEG